MNEDEADAIFDSLSSSSSISSLSSEKNAVSKEDANKEPTDEEKEREEHPERFADLCDSYGNPLPKEKRIRNSQQKENKIEETNNNIESEINTEKEVVSDINETVPEKEVNSNKYIQEPNDNEIIQYKENEEELDSFDELERQIIQGEIFGEDNEMNIQNEIINNDAPPVTLNEKPLDIEPIVTTQKKPFSVLKQKRERPKKKQIEEIEKPIQPHKKVDPKEKLQKKIEKNISKNKRVVKKKDNSEDSDDYSSSQVSTKSSGKKENELKKIPLSQNSFKNTDEEIMQLYKEKEVLKNPSYDLDPNAFNIEETQNLINDCIMKIDPRNKPYIIKLYEIIEKFKPNRNNFSFDISGILFALDKEDRKLNKIGYFFLVMMCSSLLTHAEKKGNIIKTTKDAWSKERLEHFFKTHKYQKGTAREQKKTKEEINVLMSKNGYYQSIVSQFEKYMKNGKIKELSSLLPDLIVNMYIKGFTNLIEEKTQLYRTNYFIVYAKYLKESNKFTLEVEYQNMKTSSNSDSDS